MQYRDLGKSGLKASVVGLGAFAIGGWFYGGSDEKKSIAAIHASIDAGVNLIDTAPIYGFGLSETIVGKAVRGRRNKVLLATKTGLVWDSEEGEFFTHADDAWPTDKPAKYKVYKNLKPHSIMKEVETSLKRLDTDYIDLYQTHWQDATTPVEVTMEALLKLKDQGKIRAIGVSNITVDHLKRYGQIASAQEKFSLLDRGIEKQGINGYCMEHSLAILGYFTMEQGLLTGTMPPDRQFPEGDKRKGNPKFSKEFITRINGILDGLKPYAEKYGCSVAQLIMAVTASQPGITHLLIGARDEKQAVENAAGGGIVLSAEDLAELNKKTAVLEDTGKAL
ncbi:MAG: aldo/keto reductase [Spirochaetales bacterium]|nr:MAG: aldo/keto reductase [Spirochaetales bacterium]